MFGRIQSGIFGGRQRSSIVPAPQEQERPPLPFPLPLGPPRPERELPLHAQFERVIQGPEYVHPYHMRYHPIGRQIGQADENRYAVRKAFPPAKNILIRNPDTNTPYNGLVVGNEEKSNQERSADRVYKKIRRQRYSGGSYGVGSSSIKDVIVSSRGGARAGGGGKEPPKPPTRSISDIQNEISDIDNKLRRLNIEKRRIRQEGQNNADELIAEIDRQINLLRQRKIFIMKKSSSSSLAKGGTIHEIKPYASEGRIKKIVHSSSMARYF
jgi:hypothetical protein